MNHITKFLGTAVLAVSTTTAFAADPDLLVFDWSGYTPSSARRKRPSKSCAPGSRPMWPTLARNPWINGTRPG